VGTCVSRLVAFVVPAAELTYSRHVSVPASMPGTPYSAIILSGGRAARLGGVDKTDLAVAGTTLLARVLAAVADAEKIVVSGPRAAHEVEDGDDRVCWVLEDPPNGGPVAGIAAALTQVNGPSVVILAGDLPFAAGIPAVLLRALADAPDADAVVPRDEHGWWQPLAAAYRTDALREALGALGSAHGQSARTLLSHLTVIALRVEDLPPDSLLDVDTQADLDAARDRHRQRRSTGAH